MERNIIGADVTRTSTTAKFRIGTMATVGDATYRYVRAGSGAISAYAFVYINPGADNAIGSLTTAGIGAAPAAVGCPQVAFAAYDYGWVAVRGSFTGFLGLSCAAAVKLYTTATAGLADDSATTQIVGVVSSATVGGANANTLCYASTEMSVNC